MSKKNKFGNPDNLPMTSVTKIVEYDEKELAEKAQEFASIHKEKREVEAEKKKANSAFKSSLDEKELELDKLSQILKDGGEEKEVSCFVKRDFLNRLKSYISMENGEVMEKDVPFDEADTQVEMGD